MLVYSYIIFIIIYCDLFQNICNHVQKVLNLLFFQELDSGLVDALC